MEIGDMILVEIRTYEHVWLCVSYIGDSYVYGTDNDGAEFEVPLCNVEGVRH